MLNAATIRAEIERRERMKEQAAAAEEDLLAFVRMFWRSVEPETPLVEGWPLEAMADVLMSVTDGHLRRVLINIFPGAMKSLLLNVFFPAWEWGPQNLPHLRYISASYSAGLTERDNRRLLRIVTDPVYRQCWPHVKIVRDGAERIENAATGWKLATSVGGRMTGERADRILIDDANNPKDVESDQVRGATNLWLREVMPDRLNNLDEGVIINLQQRVHEEDATGTLAKYWQGYSWLCIPMEFDPLRVSSVVLRRDENGEPADVWVDPRSLDEDGNTLEGVYTNDRGVLAVRPGSPMAQAEGTLAWPERFSPGAVTEQKRIKGPYGWSSQYQQFPTTRGGEIIRRDWWLAWTATDYPDLGTVVASLDTALEENTQADFNALTVWGAFADPAGEPKLILLAAWRLRATLAELVARVAETCHRHKVDYLLVEKKTRGRDVHDELVRLHADATWETILVVPQGDKVSRLNAVAHLFSGDCRRDPVSRMDVYSGGTIYAPLKDWADEVINEVSAFPRGAHDDFVDSTSQCLVWVRRHGVVLRKVEWEAQEQAAKMFKPPIGVPYAIGRG
jgi:phage terminase large subunit-like protein